MPQKHADQHTRSTPSRDSIPPQSNREFSTTTERDSQLTLLERTLTDLNRQWEKLEFLHSSLESAVDVTKQAIIEPGHLIKMGNTKGVNAKRAFKDIGDFIGTSLFHDVFGNSVNKRPVRKMLTFLKKYLPTACERLGNALTAASWVTTASESYSSGMTNLRRTFNSEEDTWKRLKSIVSEGLWRTAEVGTKISLAAVLGDLVLQGIMVEFGLATCVISVPLYLLVTQGVGYAIDEDFKSIEGFLRKKRAPNNSEQILRISIDQVTQLRKKHAQGNFSRDDHKLLQTYEALGRQAAESLGKMPEELKQSVIFMPPQIPLVLTDEGQKRYTQAEARGKEDLKKPGRPQKPKPVKKQADKATFNESQKELILPTPAYDFNQIDISDPRERFAHLRTLPKGQLSGDFQIMELPSGKRAWNGKINLDWQHDGSNKKSAITIGAGDDTKTRTGQIAYSQEAKTSSGSDIKWGLSVGGGSLLGVSLSASFEMPAIATSFLYAAIPVGLAAFGGVFAFVIGKSLYTALKDKTHLHFFPENKTLKKTAKSLRHHTNYFIKHSNKPKNNTKRKRDHNIALQSARKLYESTNNTNEKNLFEAIYHCLMTENTEALKASKKNDLGAFSELVQESYRERSSKLDGSLKGTDANAIEREILETKKLFLSKDTQDDLNMKLDAVRNSAYWIGEEEKHLSKGGTKSAKKCFQNSLNKINNYASNEEKKSFYVEAYLRGKDEKITENQLDYYASRNPELLNQANMAFPEETSFFSGLIGECLSANNTTMLQKACDRQLSFYSETGVNADHAETLAELLYNTQTQKVFKSEGTYQSLCDKISKLSGLAEVDITPSSPNKQEPGKHESRSVAVQSLAARQWLSGEMEKPQETRQEDSINEKIEIMQADFPEMQEYCLEEYSKHYDALSNKEYSKGETLCSKSDFLKLNRTGAIAMHRQALRKNPDNVAAAIALAKEYQGMEDFHAADQVLESTAKNCTNQIKHHAIKKQRDLNKKQNHDCWDDNISLAGLTVQSIIPMCFNSFSDIGRWRQQAASFFGKFGELIAKMVGNIKFDESIFNGSLVAPIIQLCLQGGHLFIDVVHWGERGTLENDARHKAWRELEEPTSRVIRVTLHACAVGKYAGLSKEAILGGESIKAIKKTWGTGKSVAGIAQGGLIVASIVGDIVQYWYFDDWREKGVSPETPKWIMAEMSVNAASNGSMLYLIGTKAMASTKVASFIPEPTVAVITTGIATALVAALIIYDNKWHAGRINNAYVELKKEKPDFASCHKKADEILEAWPKDKAGLLLKAKIHLRYGEEHKTIEICNAQTDEDFIKTKKSALKQIDLKKAYASYEKNDTEHLDALCKKHKGCYEFDNFHTFQEVDAFLSLGKFDEAEKVLQSSKLKKEEKSQQLTKVHLKHGYKEIKEGNPASARKFFSQAKELSPKASLVDFALITSDIQTNNFTQAQSQLNEIDNNNLAKEDSNAVKFLRYTLHYAKGKKLHAENPNALSESIAEYQKADETDPSRLDAAKKLLSLFISTGKKDAARQLLNKKSEEAQGDLTKWFVYETMDSLSPDEKSDSRQIAIKHLSDLLEIAPTHSLTRIALSNIFLLNNNLEKAEEVIAPLNTDKAKKLRSSIWKRAGFITLTSEEANFDKAKELFEKALEIDPKDPEAIAGASWSLLRIGKVAEAEEKAKSSSGDIINRVLADIEYHYAKNEDENRCWNKQDALSHCDKSLKLNPHQTQSSLLKAQIESSMGEYDQARKTLEQALEKHKETIAESGETNSIDDQPTKTLKKYIQATWDQSVISCEELSSSLISILQNRLQSNKLTSSRLGIEPKQLNQIALHCLTFVHPINSLYWLSKLADRKDTNWLRSLTKTDKQIMLGGSFSIISLLARCFNHPILFTLTSWANLAYSYYPTLKTGARLLLRRVPLKSNEGGGFALQIAPILTNLSVEFALEQDNLPGSQLGVVLLTTCNDLLNNLGPLILACKYLPMAMRKIHTRFIPKKYSNVTSFAFSCISLGALGFSLVHYFNQRNVENLIRNAKNLLKKKKFKKVIERCLAVLDVDSSNTVANYYLSIAHLSQGNLAESKKAASLGNSKNFKRILLIVEQREALQGDAINDKLMESSLDWIKENPDINVLGGLVNIANKMFRYQKSLRAISLFQKTHPQEVKSLGNTLDEMWVGVQRLAKATFKEQSRWLSKIATAISSGLLLQGGFTKEDADSILKNLRPMNSTLSNIFDKTQCAKLKKPHDYIEAAVMDWKKREEPRLSTHSYINNRHKQSSSLARKQLTPD